jgi:hypothetical protein
VPGQPGDDLDGSPLEGSTGRFTVADRQRTETEIRLSDADGRTVRADVDSVVGDRGVEDGVQAPEDA